MKNFLKVIGVIIGIMVVLGIIFFAVDYNKLKKKVYEMGYEMEFEEEFVRSDRNAFKAIIKKIREYNGITTVEIEANDENVSGKYNFSVDNNTELLWKKTKIDISSLKEGQNVSITSVGMVLDSNPATLTDVTKVIILEDKL